MLDPLELFDTVKNVYFKDLIENDGLVQGTILFALLEPNKDDWNAKAKKQNTKMFIEIHGRQPNGYEEVREWIKRNKENSSTGNTEVFDQITN